MGTNKPPGQIILQQQAKIGILTGQTAGFVCICIRYGLKIREFQRQVSPPDPAATVATTGTGMWGIDRRSRSPYGGHPSWHCEAELIRDCVPLSGV